MTIEAQAAVVPSGSAVPVQQYALSVENLKRAVQIVRDAQKAVMKKGHHYDKVPGCGPKPVLLKPGAEILAMTFQFAPTYKVDQVDLGDGHREYAVTCDLTHRPTGGYIGQGIGTCSTLETKYRFRKAEQKCPACGERTIIKGKQEYGGGWVCLKSKGGCGANYQAGDPRIENQEMGRIEHDNPADYYNTCMKMGKKRAFVDAILTSTSASDVFTQDLTDDAEPDDGSPAPARGARQAAAPGGGITDKQLNYIWRCAKDAGHDTDSLHSHLKEKFNLDSVNGLGRDQASQCIEALKSGEWEVRQPENGHFASSAAGMDNLGF
jgi:hypothetical protein